MNNNTILVFGNLKSEYLTGLKENYEVRNFDSQSRTDEIDSLSNETSCFFIDGKALLDKTLSSKIKSTIEKVNSPSILLENCKHSELVKLIGIGFDANLVFIKVLDENSVVIEILDSISEDIKEIKSEINYVEVSEENIKALEVNEINKIYPEIRYEKDFSEEVSKLQDLQKTNGTLTTKVDFETHRKELNKRINELLNGNFYPDEETNLTMMKSRNSLKNFKKQSYKVFNITHDHRRDNLYWDDGRLLQTSFIGVSFNIRLLAIDNPENSGKFCIIRQQGAGLSVGNMYENTSKSKIFYQDEVRMIYGPESSQEGLSVRNYAPPSANNSTTVSTTTGLNITGSGSGDGGALSISFDTSATVQKTYNDFSLENFTDSNQFKCNYYLTYKRLFPNDLGTPFPIIFNPGVSPFVPPYFQMNNLPSLTNSTFYVESECVWRAPLNFNRNVKYVFNVKHFLHGCHLQGRMSFRSVEPVINWDANLYIDFSLVSV